MAIKFALDSGAHSLYNIKFAGKDKDGNIIKGQHARATSDYDFYKTPAFKAYLEKYVQYLHERKNSLEFYVSLDIIFNPKASWEVQKYLESCGLNPIPVFHYGEDIKWFKKYADKYEYVGIGGLGQDITKQKFIRFCDPLFKMICDKQGRPSIKTHGFAMTSIHLVKRYPWFSVDSATHHKASFNGHLLIPKPIIKHKEILGFDYLGSNCIVPVTERRKYQKGKPVQRHISRATGVVYDAYAKYVFDHGMDIEDMGLVDNRVIMNAIYYQHVGQALKVRLGEQFDYAEGGNIYFAGSLVHSTATRERIDYFNKHTSKLGNVRFLGSFYYKSIIEKTMKFANKRKRVKLPRR